MKLVDQNSLQSNEMSCKNSSAVLKYNYLNDEVNHSNSNEALLFPPVPPLPPPQVVTVVPIDKDAPSSEK